jgi:hypothetical protein
VNAVALIAKFAMLVLPLSVAYTKLRQRGHGHLKLVIAFFAIAAGTFLAISLLVSWLS